MKYNDLIRHIKSVATSIDMVHSVYDGDVYTNWNTSDVKYGSINIGLKSMSREDNLSVYTFVFYYADRLLNDGSNKNAIWEDGIHALQAMLNSLDERIQYETPIEYNPFEQQFADNLAGVYCEVDLSTEFDLGECDLEMSERGGSGEPDKYIKDAIAEGNTLTLIKKDDSLVIFTPEGGSGGKKTELIEGGNISIDKVSTPDKDTYTLTVPDMHYDDTAVRSDIENLQETVEGVTEDLNNKVDKVSGKGLSTNDYTNTDKNAVATIGNKVDKVAGKGLSTNDYTNADKSKVGSIDSMKNSINTLEDIVTENGITIKNTKSTHDVVGYIYGKASNNLHVDATKVEFHSPIIVDGSIKADGDLNTQKVSMKGAVHAYDKMTVDGALETQDIHATTINTTDKVTIEGDLSVKGEGRFVSNINTEGDLSANGMVKFNGRLYPAGGKVTIKEGEYGASLELNHSYLVSRDSEGEYDDFTIYGEDVDLNGNRQVNLNAPAINLESTGAGVHISAPDNADALEVNGSQTKLRYRSVANVTVDDNGVKVFGNDFIYKDSEDNEISIPTELAKIKDLETFKFPNVTIFGNPTNNHGQISNFSSDDYLQFPFLVDFKNRHWEINCEFTTGDNVTNQHNIFDSNFGLAFAIQNRHFVIALSSNGTSWNIGAYNGSYTVLPETTYYIKIAWNGANYTLSYSIDSTNYIQDITVASTETLYPKQIVIGKSLDDRYIFNGIINLNKASLTIDNEIVWTGMDDAGLSTRLAKDMSNIDTAGIAKLKELAETDRKEDKFGIVKDVTSTSITVNVSPNTHYIYSELSSLSITYPTTGNDGDIIDILFKNGSTPATLVVDGNWKGSDYAPSANTFVEINAVWYAVEDKWMVVFNEISL